MIPDIDLRPSHACSCTSHAHSHATHVENLHMHALEHHIHIVTLYTWQTFTCYLYITCKLSRYTCGKSSHAFTCTSYIWSRYRHGKPSHVQVHACTHMHCTHTNGKMKTRQNYPLRCGGLTREYKTGHYAPHNYPLRSGGSPESVILDDMPPTSPRIC